MPTGYRQNLDRYRLIDSRMLEKAVRQHYWKVEAERKKVRSFLTLNLDLSLLNEAAAYPTVGKSAFSCIAKPMSPLILSRPDMATACPLNWPCKILMQSSPAIESNTCGSSCIPSTT